jgi:hypothetical protein
LEYLLRVVALAFFIFLTRNIMWDATRQRLRKLDVISCFLDENSRCSLCTASSARERHCRHFTDPWRIAVPIMFLALFHSKLQHFFWRLLSPFLNIRCFRFIKQIYLDIF